MLDDLQDGEVFDQTKDLLATFFTEHQQGWEELLAVAFKAYSNEPRPGLKAKDISPAGFAAHCATALWDARCLGAGRHPLGRLMEVCAERERSARSAAMESLAHGLHGRCRLPPRVLEQRYLAILLATPYLAASAKIYAPLDAIGSEAASPAALPTLPCWEDRPELLIRPRVSVRRATSEDARSEPRHYEDIQEAFDKNGRGQEHGAVPLCPPPGSAGARGPDRTHPILRSARFLDGL